MNQKKLTETMWKLALSLLGGLFLFPTQAQANTLSQEGAQAYLDVVNGYTQQYGTAVAKENQYPATVGMAQSRLLDYNGDGDLELLVFYIDTAGEEETSGFLELWETNGNQAQQVLQETICYYRNIGSETDYTIYQVEGQWKLYCSSNYGSPGRYSTSGELFSLSPSGLDSYANWEYSENDWDFNGNTEVSGTFNKEEIKETKEETLKTRFQNEYLTGSSFKLLSGINEWVSYPTTSCITELETLATAPILLTGEGTGETYPQHATYTPTTTGTIAQSYLDVLAKIKNQYGTSDGQSVGLVASFLEDLNGDGQEELLLTYCTVSGSYNPTIVLEIWEYAGNSALKTFHQTYQKSFGQPSYWSYDWRDVGHFYPYENSWVLYLAGGGGNEEYQSYDEVYSYRNNSFFLTASDSMHKFTRSDGNTTFGGSVNGEYYHNEGTSVANAIPDWYAGFKAIQEEYLSGTPVELFYMDKDEYRWTVHSCETILQERINAATPAVPQVVIPSKTTAPEVEMAKAYQGVLDELRTQYGTFEKNNNSLTTGVVQSFLGDFTGDGQDNLYVSYFSGWVKDDYDDGSTAELIFEIWKIQDNQPVKIHTGTNYCTTGFHDHGSTSHLVEKGGKYYIYSFMQGGDGGYYEISGVENDTFKTLIQYSFSTGGAEINGIFEDSDPQGYQGEWDAKMSGFTFENLILIHSSGTEFDSLTALPTLANLLAIPESSHHYFGYPVTFDEEIHNNMASLALNGQLLAVYQVEESLFYGIVEVNGVQQGLLVKEEGGDWEIYSSATENLTYEALESEKTAFLQRTTGESQDSSEEKEDSSSSTQDSEEESKVSGTFMVIWLGLMAVIAVALVVCIKNLIKEKKSTK